jgi:hypothetical protein
MHRFLRETSSLSSSPSILVEDRDEDDDGDDESAPPPSQTPPSFEENPAAQFEIKWSSLRLSGDVLPGQVGYRIRHKRSIGGAAYVSPIWKHGADLEWLHKGRRRQLFLCQKCYQAKNPRALYKYNGTDHITRHLANVHYIGKDGLIESAPLPANPFEAARGIKGPPQELFNEHGYLETFRDWVIKQDITFRQATHEDTRVLISYGKPEIEPLLVRSHSTLKSYIEKAYETRQVEVKDVLLASSSKIHISCDVWTSTNGLSLLGVVAHFLGMYSPITPSLVELSTKLSRQ